MHFPFHEPSSPVLCADVIEGYRMADTCDMHVPLLSYLCMYLRLGKVNMGAWRCLQSANEVVD
jgi:hypothetical protein